MYLSKGKILLSRLIAVLLILISVFFIFIGIVGVGLVISWIFDDSGAVVKNSIGEYLAVYVGFFAVFVPLFVIGIKKLRLCGKANKFNSIFESDPDGVISAEKTAALFGKPLHEFIALFDLMVKKGYLINCSIENPDNPVIALHNGGDTAKDRFDVVHCPNCGAPSPVKQDFVEQCPYCGSKL